MEQDITPNGRITFLDLPEDILVLVCAYIEGHDRFSLSTVPRFEENFLAYDLNGTPGPNRLIKLSETCRKLRLLCAPRIFRFPRLDVAHRLRDILAHRSLEIFPVLSHARRLLIGDRGAEPGRLAALLELAGDMREVYLRRNVEPLPTLLQSQKLEILALSNAVWASIRTDLPLPAVRAPLRSLRICTPNRVKDMVHRHVDLSCEILWIEELCAQLCTRLEVLALPAEALRISVITAAPWPCLRELFLYGYCPILDSPLQQIFETLPKLRALSLIIATPLGQAPLVLWPRGSHAAPEISGLRRLALSSPSPDDGIFGHLPPELEELSLRDLPRLYEFHRYHDVSGTLDNAYKSRILSCGEALSIFRRMPSCAALRHLELVVTEDEHELDMLAYIAASCARLELLELHCYRNVTEYDDLVHAPLAVSLDTLGGALSEFRALRVARLNIDLPWSQFTISRRIYRGRSDGFTFTETIAQTVARAVPWLEHVCVLARCEVGLFQWRVWAVHTRGNGNVELECLELRGLDSRQLYDQ